MSEFPQEAGTERLIADISSGTNFSFFLFSIFVSLKSPENCSIIDIADSTKPVLPQRKPVSKERCFHGRAEATAERRPRFFISIRNREDGSRTIPISSGTQMPPSPTTHGNTSK